MRKILFLCHGNICRSAAAEALFYDDDSYPETVRKAQEMRRQGKAVVLWRR